MPDPRATTNDDAARLGTIRLRRVRSHVRVSATDVIDRPRPARAAGTWVVAISALFLLVAAPLARAATHSQKIDPFAAGWTVSAKASGYCASASAATKRPDAFRCYRGSYAIMDPCFSSPSSSGEVLCVDSPWSKKAIEVQLTKPVPVAAPDGTASIWAVVLANGARCTIDNEDTDVAFGHTVGWACTNGELAQGLHSGSTWWALWQPSSGIRWRHVSIRMLYR